MDRRDLILIGGGPGGYVAAIRASQLGAKVLLVEKENLGGTCLHRGCVPTKSLLRGVEVLETVRRSKRYGISVGGVDFNFARMAEYKAQVVRTLLSGLQSLMKENAIEVMKGEAKLTSATGVEVETEVGNHHFQADRIILAPGSLPARPLVPGVEGPGVITTDEVFDLSEIPKSMAIIGAGACGLEFAAIFARLGSKISLVEMLPQIIPTEDEEIARAMERPLWRMGVQIFTRSLVSNIEDGRDGAKIITLETEAERKKVEAQLVLIATGRQPNTRELGAERAGVRLEKGAIAVNERMETSVPGIYAAGDAVGKIMLAHVAFMEGEVAAENALGKDSVMDYRAVPRCIYTMPEVAAVGLTEKEALDKGYDIKVGRFTLVNNSKALILGERDGFVKIVAEAGSEDILGVHILSPQATELIAEATLLVKMKGTLKDVISLIHAHPTLHEAVREAALDVSGEAIHKPPRK